MREIKKGIKEKGTATETRRAGAAENGSGGNDGENVAENGSGGKRRGKRRRRARVGAASNLVYVIIYKGNGFVNDGGAADKTF